MFQPFELLCRAVKGTGATAYGLTFRPQGRGTAFWTGVRKVEFRRSRNAPIYDHAHHLWDYVTGPLDHHRVTNTDVLAADFIFIMKRGV